MTDSNTAKLMLALIKLQSEYYLLSCKLQARLSSPECFLPDHKADQQEDGLLDYNTLAPETLELMEQMDQVEQEIQEVVDILQERLRLTKEVSVLVN